jgi:probable phosphoglycerate mutase
MRLLLVRHAESHHSRRGVIAGVRGCTGLTDGGHSQARALASRFASDAAVRQGVVLLSSPVLRARQTADVLADALSGQRVGEDTDLCELRPGDADGAILPPSAGPRLARRSPVA